MKTILLLLLLLCTLSAQAQLTLRSAHYPTLFKATTASAPTALPYANEIDFLFLSSSNVFSDAAETTIATNGQFAKAWRDVSGAVLSARDSTSAPLFLSSQMGSQPSVAFYRTNYLDIRHSIFTGQRTIYTVIRRSGGGVSTIISGENNSLQYRLDDGRQRLVKAGVADIGLAGTALTSNAFHSANVSFDHNSGEGIFRLNGVTNGTVSTAGPIAVSPADIYIGKSATASEELSGDVIFLCQYQGFHTLAKKQEVEAWIDASIAAQRFTPTVPVGRQMHRWSTNAVLVKGGSYGGWDANALAAPQACWDGTRFVMTLSAWSVASNKWATMFFTSSNLTAWSYVTNSLWRPSGVNYILGNAGLQYWSNAYWFAYNEYQTSPGFGVNIATSTNLTNWTITATALGTNYVDPQLSINPTNGLLELAAVDVNRAAVWLNTTNGTNWYYKGIITTAPFFASTDFGEPAIYYNATNAAVMTYDGANVSGRRSVGVGWSLDGFTSFTTYATTLGPDPVGLWDSVNCFDSAPVGRFDIGDGRGTKLWMLYAGSNIAAATDDTESSIGLVWIDDIQP